jgi:hypothetical protein
MTIADVQTEVGELKDLEIDLHEQHYLLPIACIAGAGVCSLVLRQSRVYPKAFERVACVQHRGLAEREVNILEALPSAFE